MGRNKDIRSESDDISGKVVITMAKKHVGIGIAAIAAGAGACHIYEEKISEKAKEGTDGCPVSGLPEHRTRKTGEK